MSFARYIAWFLTRPSPTSMYSCRGWRGVKTMEDCYLWLWFPLSGDSPTWPHQSVAYSDRVYMRRLSSWTRLWCGSESLCQVQAVDFAAAILSWKAPKELAQGSKLSTKEWFLWDWARSRLWGLFYGYFACMVTSKAWFVDSRLAKDYLNVDMLWYNFIGEHWR